MTTQSQNPEPAKDERCDACGYPHVVKRVLGGATSCGVAFPNETILLCQLHYAVVAGEQVVKLIRSRRSAKSAEKTAPSASSVDSAKPIVGAERAAPVSTQPAGGQTDPYRATTIQQCLHLHANLLRGECPDCGASSLEARVIGKPKPRDASGYLGWSDKQGKKQQALDQLGSNDHLRDRRPIMAATGGRFSRAVSGHPKAWPADSEHEGMV